MMSMMTLLSTKAEASVIASEFVHDFVGGFTAHLIFPDPDDGFDALTHFFRAVGGRGSFLRRHRGREDFPGFGLHRALMAGGAEAEFLFHAFIEIANREGGAHCGKVSSASIAVNRVFFGGVECEVKREVGEEEFLNLNGKLKPRMDADLREFTRMKEVERCFVAADCDRRSE